jgi:hypothetical protein
MASWPQDLFDEGNQVIGFAFGNLSKQVKEIKDYKQKVNPKGGLLGIHYLPLPANIEDNTTHDWESRESFGAQMENYAINEGYSLGSMNPVGRRAIDIVKMKLDSEGFKVDPNYTYVYQGSAPRNFTYSINMIPKNADEALAIQKIIKDFKKFSAPFKEQHVRNSYWQIEIVNVKLRDMTIFDKKAWALTSVSVNYSGAGASLFFEDGMPKQINLSLAFQEIETIYRSDYSKKDKG